MMVEQLEYIGRHLMLTQVMVLPTPLNPNKGKKLEDMIPAGAYIVGGADYSSTGLESTSTEVRLTVYSVIYNTNGGTINASNSSSYDIETKDLRFPKSGGWGITLMDGNIKVLRLIKRLFQQQRNVPQM